MPIRIPFHDSQLLLAGVEVDEAVTQDSELVNQLEIAIPRAMPGLEFFHLGVRPRHLLFDQDRLRIRDAFGVRALRSDDHESLERNVEDQFRSLLKTGIRRVFSVDRVYGFAWHSFRQSTWAELQVRYRRTLGWVEAKDLARWFGSDETQIPHLWGSVEPVGLQIAGIVEQELLDRWHESFLVATEGLPSRNDADAE